MLRDGLHSELAMSMDENVEVENERAWDRRAFCVRVAQQMSIARSGMGGQKKLSGSIESDSFLMRRESALWSSKGKGKGREGQFGFVTEHGLVLDLCADAKAKRGVVVLGPSDAFIGDGEERMVGEVNMNVRLLRELKGWDVLTVHWQTHKTDEAMLETVSAWVEKHREADAKRRKLEFIQQ